MIEQTSTPQTYPALLASIKERIQRAQVRAAVAVNQELVLLYWSIGKEILTSSTNRAGARASSLDSQRTSVLSSRIWTGYLLAISGI